MPDSRRITVRAQPSAAGIAGANGIARNWNSPPATRRGAGIPWPGFEVPSPVFGSPSGNAPGRRVPVAGTGTCTAGMCGYGEPLSASERTFDGSRVRRHLEASRAQCWPQWKFRDRTGRVPGFRLSIKRRGGDRDISPGDRESRGLRGTAHAARGPLAPVRHRGSQSPRNSRRHCRGGRNSVLCCAARRPAAITGCRRPQSARVHPALPCDAGGRSIQSCHGPARVAAVMSRQQIPPCRAMPCEGPPDHGRGRPPDAAVAGCVVDG